MPEKQFFEDDDKSALQAIKDAQFIAFAPYVFQASVTLRDKGILAYVEEARTTGRTIQEVAEAVNLPYYGTRVLMEAALGIDLMYRRDGRYHLAKTGHIFLNQPMARINTDFMRDVCYDSAADLEASVVTGKPVGLQRFGNWDTIYQGLSVLPDPAGSSWFAFDHFYSDRAFPAILPLVFAAGATRILDIGANTGKFAMACLAQHEQAHIGLLDLEGQLSLAQKNIGPDQDRVTYHPHDILDNNSALPTGYDTIFMSQFLDCFSDQQIKDILQKCYDALDANGRIFINETFWDCQKFEASAFSLQMASLYFTTIANGNSQMYDSQVYLEILEDTGFTIAHRHDHIGLSHTLLELKKKA